MRSKETNRKTKMRVHGVAIRPVVTCGVETMILTKGEEEKLRRFERKIYDPKGVVEDGLMNSEVQERFQGENIVKVMKKQRLRWYSHTRRKGEEEVVKKVIEWKPEQEEDAEVDGRNIKRLRIHNWRGKIQGIAKETKMIKALK